MAAHLHFAVVEVGGPGFVFDVLAPFAQCPVEAGDLARCQRTGRLA
jgi:hypothetical protein